MNKIKYRVVINESKEIMRIVEAENMNDARNIVLDEYYRNGDKVGTVTNYNVATSIYEDSSSNGNLEPVTLNPTYC